MSPSICVIFDNPRAVYFPGQTITGKVLVSLTSSKNCRGVKMIFRGFSNVHWEEVKKEDNMNVTHHHRSKEEYYHMKFYVWGNGSSTSLPAGQHAFDFRFILPHNIPSSFQSDIGYVRHLCTAELDLPFVSDKTCSVPFSVNSISDLNLIPGAENPINATKTKNLCCLCCKSGPMSFVLNIEKSGYVCGEKILINAECTNMTDRVLRKSVAELMQTITYNAEDAQKKETRVVASVEHPEIPPGDSDIWSGVPLSVPPLPPSDLQGCTNIKIEYQFKFRIDPGSMGMDLKKVVPLIIGTIPLQKYHNQIVAPSSTATSSEKPSVPGSPPGYPAPGVPPGYPAPGAPPDYLGGPGMPQGNPPPYEATPGYPSAPGTQPGYPAPQPGYPSGAPYPTNHPPPPQPGMQPGYPAAPVGPAYPEASAPPAVAMGFPGLELYPNMPAPSFSECYFGPMQYKEGDGSDDRLGPNFAPSYVTYGFS